MEKTKSQSSKHKKRQPKAALQESAHKSSSNIEDKALILNEFALLDELRRNDFSSL